MINATYIEYAPKFGQILKHHPAESLMDTLQEPIKQAAEILTQFQTGKMAHGDCIVRSCQCKIDPFSTNTGNKVFDAARRSSGGFMTGNVVSNVQCSSFIRAESNLNCNNHTFKPGELRTFDLNWLYRAGEGSLVAKNWLINETLKDTETILYRVFHRGANKSLVDHGWFLTDTRGKLLNELRLNNSPRYGNAIMDQARAAFTLERSYERDLLIIKDHELVYVDPSVNELAADKMQEIENQNTRHRERG